MHLICILYVHGMDAMGFSLEPASKTTKYIYVMSARKSGACSSKEVKKDFCCRKPFKDIFSRID